MNGEFPVTLVREFKLNCAPLGCEFDQQGRYLLLGCEDNQIRQWNRDTGEQSLLAGHESWVRSFVFPAADQFISAGYDGCLIWWTREAGQPRIVVRKQAHQGWIRAIGLNFDRQLLVSAGNDRVVRVWSMSDRELVHQLSGHADQICSLAVHPHDPQCVSADHQGVIKVWDLTTGKLVREIDGRSTVFENRNNRGVSGGFRGLMFLSNGEKLCGTGVVAGGDPLGQAVNPGLTLFDWNSGKPERRLRARGNEQGVAWSQVYHPGRQFVAAISGGLSAKHLYFWKTGEELPFHELELPSPGRAIALHPDGDELAVALFDGKVQCYGLGSAASKSGISPQK